MMTDSGITKCIGMIGGMFYIRRRVRRDVGESESVWVGQDPISWVPDQDLHHASASANLAASESIAPYRSCSSFAACLDCGVVQRPLFYFLSFFWCFSFHALCTHCVSWNSPRLAIKFYNVSAYRGVRSPPTCEVRIFILFSFDWDMWCARVGAGLVPSAVAPAEPASPARGQGPPARRLHE